MTNKLTFKLEKKDWVIQNQEWLSKTWKAYLPKLNNWKYVVEIKKDYVARSLRQNRAWWGVIVDFLANYHEIDKDDMHKHIKTEYLTQRYYDPITEEEREYTRSSKTLNSKEFTQLIERVKQDYLDQYWIEIPKILNKF